MSPDQYYSTPKLKQLNERAKQFAKAFPTLYHHFVVLGSDFNGLTMFLGDHAEVVVGVRRFSSDGSPEIAWSSGDDCLQALHNLETGWERLKWRPDRPRVAADS